MGAEFGLEGIVSTSSDVYSYGIMLMETFTGKKPTDVLFAGDLSLKSWVSNQLPNTVNQVIDAKLIRPEEKGLTAKLQCVSSIVELALNCSADLPEERSNMTDVLTSLKKIRLQFLAI